MPFGINLDSPLMHAVAFGLKAAVRMLLDVDEYVSRHAVRRWRCFGVSEWF